MARRSSEAPHRHTVPNSSYASFPCFQEELKLKTNLLKCDTAANGTPESAHENFQVNVSMHDKLKMCFAEMETMKDQFEAKRSKVTRKRLKKERSDTSDTAQSKPRPSSSMAAEDSNRSTIKETRTKLPFDTEKPSTLPSVEENKFKAHLIRTNSKDSMDGTERDMGKSFEVLSHSPAYDETYISPTARPLPPVGMMPTGVNLNSNRRTVSDPFGDLGGLASRTRAERMGDTLAQSGGQSAFGGARHSFEPFTNSPFNWRAAVEKTSYDDLAQSKSAETRRSYDEWLQKLDEVNDISRSTQKRIRNLEKEVINLRTNTDNLLQKPTKHFTSRIPVTTAATASGQPLFTAYHSASQCKKFTDKCTNTDIDLNFMNELLNNWKSKSNQQLDGEENNELRRRRRMTTTIGRSIEIQTEQKICQEKGISTDDWIPPSSTKQFNSEKSYIYNQAPSTSKDAPKPSTSQMSILDMPNIEGEQTLHYFDPQVTAGKISTEPVIEMYDSDTSFDAADQTNFEKNMEFIYSQISRRALNQSRLMTRKEVSVENEYNNLKYRPLRNSSTQTSTERERPKQLLKEATTSKAEKSEAKNQPHMVLPKKLHSSSKIIIERVRMNQKEKNEIQIETDIDNNKGTVHRTTQVKNQKYRRPKETSTTTAATSHNVPSFKSTTNSQPVSKHMRKVNSDMNVCHSRSIISRPVSAFDLASNSDFDKKKEDNFFNDNKALSSSMIVENHERSRFSQQKKEIYDDIIRKSPSEGYHSSNRIGTPSQDYLIEPPKSFQNMNNSYSEPSWEEVSKSEVTNKMVNETMDAFKEMEMARDGFLTLTNETVIDNTGKQTNITTKSRTIRKYKPKDKTKSNLDLSQAVPSRVDTPTDLARSRSTSQFNLDRYKALQPIDADPPLYYGQVLDDLPQETPRSLVPKEPSQPTMCNFSLVYNCDNNLVFRANFGLAKLPCFETNL